MKYFAHHPGTLKEQTPRGHIFYGWINSKTALELSREMDYVVRGAGFGLHIRLDLVVVIWVFTVWDAAIECQ